MKFDGHFLAAAVGALVLFYVMFSVIVKETERAVAMEIPVIQIEGGVQ